MPAILKPQGSGCPSGMQLDPDGNCWACPAGAIRTWAAVTADNACINNNIEWETNRAAVGIFNIPGASAAIYDAISSNSTLLYSLALSFNDYFTSLKGQPPADPSALLKEIMNNPGTSQLLALIVFARLQAIIVNGGASSNDEQCLLDWWLAYVGNTRLWIASQGMDMYNSWYQAMQLRGGEVGSILGNAESPPDFSSLFTSALSQPLTGGTAPTYTAAVVLGGLSLGVAGAIFSGAAPSIIIAMLDADIIAETMEEYAMTFVEAVDMAMTSAEIAVAAAGPIAIAVSAVLVIAVLRLLTIISMDQAVSTLQTNYADAMNNNPPSFQSQQADWKTAGGIHEGMWILSTALAGGSTPELWLADFLNQTTQVAMHQITISG